MWFSYMFLHIIKNKDRNVCKSSQNKPGCVLGAGLPVALVPRKRLAARRHGNGGDEEAESDVKLVQRLSALEDFLTQQGLEV